ncbi:MAG: serine O-acetyltransferase [Aphanocapsa lilacina HA4352-LM1]|jgi:serine O-acetyltransferase|nr:serine O-acetyltransferase [Aphanocapsa lilacina HA4352-LM1]
MFENLKEDIEVFRQHHGGSWVSFLYYPMFTAVVLYRFSSWCYRHRLKPVAYLAVRLNDFLHGVWIGPRVKIGPGLFLAHARGLIVNPDTVIGNRCVILQNVTLGGPNIVVGDNVLIGAGALIISREHRVGGLAVGDNAKIGAGAVVLKDVPEGAVMVGNPARDVSKKEVNC